MKGVCIIPARGGSKRVPRKNIKSFMNSSLLEITIQEVIESKQFDKIIVTSDDKEIIDVASKYSQITTHYRSKDLSSDAATVFEVFHNILLTLDGKYDFIAGVLVTTPFKKKRHYIEAVDQFKMNKGKKNIISVVKFDYPPQFGFQLSGGKLNMQYPEMFAKTTNSKFIKPWYHNNGAIWISSVENYIKTRTFYMGDLLPYEMDAISSYDIDYPYQFEIAEIIAKKLMKKEITL